MRKLLPGIIFAALLVPNQVSGQGSWLSATNVAGNGDVILTDMEVDSNGDSYILGWFNTNIVSTAGSITTKGNYDIFLLKVNSDGTHAWLKGFGGTLVDLPGGVEIGPDGSVYISGAVNGTVFFDATTSITTTAADAFLANFEPDGTLNWVKIAAGGPKAQRSEAMDLYNGRIILAGYAVDSVIYDVQRVGRLGKFTHIATYDLDGNHLLSNTIGFKDVGLPTSIEATTDGYAISGYFRDSLFLDIDTLRNQSVTPASDIFLYKVDANLDGQWVRRTTSMFGENVAYSVRFDGTDDLYLVGKTGSLDLQIDSTATETVQVIRTTGSDEFFIFNYLNSDGSLDWYTIDGSNRGDGLWDIMILPERLVSTGYYSGNYYFGIDTLINPISKEIFVTVHDINGQIIHASEAYSEPVRNSDQGYRLGLTEDGVIVIAGVYRSEIVNFESTQFSNSNPGAANIFVAKYGCLGGGSLATSSTDLICYNDHSGEITLTATGGFTSPHYSHEYDAFFDNGDTVFFRKFNSPAVLTGFEAGTYEITVYDNANCLIGISNETLSQPDSLHYAFEAVHPDCNAAVTGSITFSNVQGGVPPYRYSINCGEDFQTDAVFSDLPAGHYCIIVEDAGGCQTPALDTTLIAPAVIGFGFEVVNDSLKCYGYALSEIHFRNVSGGSDGYLFSVDGGSHYQVDSSFTGLTGGSYQLIVSDVNACASAVIDTFIYQPAAIIPYYHFTDTLCFGELGEITFDSVSGGAGNLVYSVNGGGDFTAETSFTSLAGGDYQLVVQDDSLCTSEVTEASILILDELMVAGVTYDTISGDNPEAFIQVEVSGGATPYLFVLTPGDVSQDHGLFAIVDAGIYTIEVNDALNCGPVTTDEITILDVTGILDYVFTDALVYPNPSTGQITIEMTVHSQETLLEVMGLTGQVVKSEMIYHHGGKIRQNIDLQNLSKGMYMLRVDGKMLRSAIVLQ